MKFSEIFELADYYETLINVDLPAQLYYDLTKFNTYLKKYIEVFDKIRSVYYDRFATEFERGTRIILPENEAAYNEKIQELLNVNTELEIEI